MSWPTKILPFRALVRPPVVVSSATSDEFPRFHKEQLRGPTGTRPRIVGFGIPPATSR